MKLDIEVTGVEKLQTRLSKVLQGTKDLSPALRDLSVMIIGEFKANFPARGSVLEDPWPPRKKSYPWPILQKTGKLRSTWDKEISPHELIILNPVDYAEYHHFGGSKLPIRRLVGKSKNILRMITNKLEKYINSLIR